MRAIKIERQGWRQRAHSLIGLLRTAWSEYERDYAGFLASATVYS